jgi:alpha-tubulin suppressor-like RCC1 family protein
LISRHIDETSDGATETLFLNQRHPKDREQPKFIAISHTDRTCIVLPAPTVKEQSRIFEFDSYEKFETWSILDDPFHPDVMPEYFDIPGRIINLVAGATCFAALTHEGHVLTWGDSRHPKCLARLPIEAEPAYAPGMVESFGGIPISKIASGGWLFGALSKDRDVYLWGSGKPGNQDKLITALGFGEDDITPVEIPGVDKIIDFGI